MRSVIRELQPGDLGWVISKHGEIYSSEFGFDATFEFLIAEKAVEFVNKSDPFKGLFIVLVDSIRAGSIAVSTLNENQAFVNFLLVEQHFRSHGLARKLLTHVIDHCRHHSFSSVRLETYSCLTNARKLYGTFGFSCVESYPEQEKYGRIFDQEFWELSL